MDQMTTDVNALRESVADISSQMGKLQQQMMDIGNAVRTIQTPAAAPPPGPAGIAPGGGGAAREPVRCPARPPKVSRRSPATSFIKMPIATAAAAMTIWRCRNTAII